MLPTKLLAKKHNLYKVQHRILSTCLPTLPVLLGWCNAYMFMGKPSFTILAPEIYDEDNRKILGHLELLCEKFSHLEITEKVFADVLEVLGDTKEEMVTERFTRDLDKDYNPTNSINILYVVIANGRDKFFLLNILNTFHDKLQDTGYGMEGV